MSTEQPFQFSFLPEPRRLRMEAGTSQTIAFTVENRSDRPVLATAFLQTGRDPLNGSGPARWAHWLQIVDNGTERPEMLLSPREVRNFTVAINLPRQLHAGDYEFQFGLLGVTDPDREVDLSEPVTFTVAPLPDQINIGKFALGALLVIALLTLAIFGATYFLSQTGDTSVLMIAPDRLNLDEVGVYSLTVSNNDPEPFENVIVQYTPAAGVAGGVLLLPDEKYRHCDEAGPDFFCTLGRLPANEQVEVAIQALPRPGATVITNTDTVLVHYFRNGQEQTAAAKVDGGRDTTPVIATSAPLHLAVDPGVATATVGEPFNYDITAWHEGDTARPLWLDYRLPEGLRYTRTSWPDAAEPGPGQCLPAAGDYFRLRCYLGIVAPGELATARIRVVPTQVTLGATPGRFVLLAGETGATAPAAREFTPDACPLQATIAAAGSGDDAVCLELPLSIVNSALRFDGESDWAELGYRQVPQDFTVELWVNPATTQNGQGLIGAHLADGENVFLVGYYNDGLDIRVDAVHETLSLPGSERYHLAIVVDAISATESHVTVYINGDVFTDWLTPEDEEQCGSCKVYGDSIDPGTTTLPWVLGMDWDQGTPERRMSDFFEGTLSDVRLWQGERSQKEIRDNMQRRALLPETVTDGGEAQGNATLIGYWPLTPVPRAAGDANAMDDNPLLVDLQAPLYDGQRYGPTWIDTGPYYGTALAFDGIDDSLGAPFALPAVGSSDTYTVAYTLSAWLAVDSVPTEDAWVAGYAPLVGGSDRTGGAQVATAVESAAREQLRALGGTDAQVAAAVAEAEAVRADAATELISAREQEVEPVNRLILALMQDLELNPQTPDEGALLPPEEAPTTLPVTLTLVALPGQTLPDRELLSAQIAAAESYLATRQLSPPAANVPTPTPVANAQASLLTDNGDVAALQQLRETLIGSHLAYQSALRAFRAELEPLQAAAEAESETEEAAQPQITPALLASAAQLSFSYVDLMESNLAYARALLRLYVAEQAGEEAPLALAALDRLAAGREENAGYQALLLAAENRAAPADVFTPERRAALRQWAEAVEAGRVLEALDALEPAAVRRERAEEALAAAEEKQETVADIQSQREALQTLLAETNENETERQDLLQTREAARDEVTTALPEDRETAQAQLAAADTALAQARFDTLNQLKVSLVSLQAQEQILDGLTPKMQVALADAYRAGVEAVEQQLLEAFVDKILIDFLRGRASDFPLPETQQAIFDEAQLAAQVSLKNDVDGAVDLARAERDRAIARRDRTQSLPLTAAQRQQLIDYINNYLDALNADVNEAQQKLEEAIQAQREAQAQDEESVLEVPSYLADALAEAIAAQVRDDLSSYLCTNPAFSFAQLNCGGFRINLFQPTNNYGVLINDILFIKNPHTTRTLEARLEQRGKNLDFYLYLVRFRARWHLRLAAAFSQVQIARELQEGIEDSQQRRMRLLLQQELTGLEASLRALLAEERRDPVLARDLLGTTAAVVGDVERQQRLAELLRNFNASAGRVQQILRVILGELPGLPAATTGALAPPLKATTPLVTTVRLSSAPVRARLGGSRVGLGTTTVARSSGHSAAAPPIQAATPTPVPSPTPAATQESLPSSQPTATSAVSPDQPSTPPASGPTATPMPDAAATATPSVTATPSATLPITTVAESGLWLALVIDNDGHVALVARPEASATWSSFKDDVAIPTGRWVHYTGSISYRVGPAGVGTPELHLYRDGARAKASARPTTFTAPPAVDCLDGAAGFYLAGVCGRLHFQGLLDEVRFWNRALPPAEVSQWPSRPDEQFDEQAYWPFDDGPILHLSNQCGDVDPVLARASGLSCDHSRHNHHLQVIGPRWIEADLAAKAVTE